MSAYGDIKHTKSSVRLPSTVWKSESRVSDGPELGYYISVHHFTLTTARALPGFLEYLGAVFAEEIENGMTYPQEGDMRQETFEAYFFSADVFVGVVGSLPKTVSSGSEQASSEVEDERAGRTWDECVAGYYYVGHFTGKWMLDNLKAYHDIDIKIKPNYPGRSSHVSTRR